MSIRIEIVDQVGRSNSVTYLHQGDSLCYPLTPRHPFTDELVVIFPTGGFNHATRFRFGPIKGIWSGTYDQIRPGQEYIFAVPPQNRLFVKNLA